jgi:outer membrane protein assembly factor BamB
MSKQALQPVKNILFVGLILLAATLLTGCAGGAMAASSWPGLSADSTTAYVAYGPAIYAVDLSTGQELWRYPKEANRSITFYAPPATSESGVVIVGGYDNKVYALNPGVGREPDTLWQFDQSKDRIIGGLVVAGEIVLVPSADGQLYALNLNTGEPVWQEPFLPRQVPDPLWADPAVENDRVYLASLDHHVYALDLNTGAEIWQVDLSGAISDTPTLTDGILLIGTFGNKLYALQATNGKTLWSLDTEGWVWGNPAVGDGIAYFGDVSGKAYAVSIEDGSEIWRQTIDGAIAATPTLGTEGVYFVTETGRVVSVDPQTGQRLWPSAAELNGKILTDPIFVEGKLLVATMDPDCLLYEIDAQSGAVRCMFQPAD